MPKLPSGTPKMPTLKYKDKDYIDPQTYARAVDLMFRSSVVYKSLYHLAIVQESGKTLCGERYMPQYHTSRYTWSEVGEILRCKKCDATQKKLSAVLSRVLGESV